MKSPPKTPPSITRLFSEQDEIELLKAFEQSSTTNPNFTISSFQFRQFTQPQISSKLKRLKAKYHSMAKSKSKIKTQQHRQIYSIGRMLWGPGNGGQSKSMHVVVEEGELKEKEEVDLEKYPFLVESVPEEVKRIGGLYLDGLRSLGEEKCRELNDEWMVLSIRNAEIETEKSLLLQKQFIVVAEAARTLKM